ncbi:hypothetical protein GIB67_021343 [Kingdonia uniflora]|uniref:Disease resistance protein RPM1-like n=1 Tax=Kingdonia uniflora TaxID=39325 RepID=A0A7J7MCQ3_9MAGN|nr:hypothetical protein GIB67_021343 [Kingdonia uniflora]
MAVEAMTFVLEKVVALFEEEVKLLGGVSHKVDSIKAELQSMRAFLRDANDRGESDEGVKVWVEQVRDVSYDTEDILDEFMFLIEQKPQWHGVAGFCKDISVFLKRLKAKRQLSYTVKDIKRKICDISDRRLRYPSSKDNLQHDSTSTELIHSFRRNAGFGEETDLIGVENPRRELIGLLLEGESRVRVIPVVGMGGVGKTTLVKKVYDRVMDRFQHLAWVTVSKSFDLKQILREVIRQLFQETIPPAFQDLETMTETKLMQELFKSLQDKRYLIVFDDIWDIRAWEALKSALPDCGCCSRIMITTRDTIIARSCIRPYGEVYNLQQLQEEDAWSLFLKKTFSDNSCPRELEKLSRGIVKKCKGLPLVIGAIGGLLSTKDKNLFEWMRVHKSIGAQLEDNIQLLNAERVLLLSYNDLPHHLKPCFLYLSIFPEDFSIERMRLIRLWIAEGFIREIEGFLIEEVAEDYLMELINRNLIQISKTEIDRSLRSCQVHDIFREIITRKSREENFATVFVHENTRMNENIRRLSIHSTEGIVLEKKSLSHLRSLFTFRYGTVWSSPVCNFPTSRLKLLRVLDLADTLLEIFPLGIVNLFLLRYLSLRNTLIKELPKSISKLGNLETLDLKQTRVTKLPVEILKLKKLRHLLVYRYEVQSYLPFHSKQGFKVMVGIGGLVSLQKLSIVDANEDSGILRELGKLTQLRKLGIINLWRKDGVGLCTSIQKMIHLRSLDVTSLQADEILDLDSLTSCPPLLERLYMRGPLTKLPGWISELANLVTLSLRWSRLEEDPLESLQGLPMLMELGLHQAYEGTELCFKKNSFLLLKLLSINDLNHLEMVRFEEGALPCLQALCIQRCEKLQDVPKGIELLKEVKELQFYGMSDSFCTRLLPNRGQDHWKVKHIPDVRFFYYRDEWKLWPVDGTDILLDPSHQTVGLHFAISSRKKTFLGKGSIC